VTGAAQPPARRAVILGHLSQDPARALTCCELARVAGCPPGSLAKLLRSMERRAQIVEDPERRLGRKVSLWRIALPGTVPPPRVPVPLPPERLAARRKRDREYQRDRRARLREQQHPSPRPVNLPPGAACAAENPDLFFPAAPEDEAKAMAICAHCVIRAECLAGAQATGQTYGIWGGVNFENRDHAGDREANMTTLISCSSSGGDQGRCDAECYDAREPDCDCICGGRNRGAGREQAIENTRELAQGWIEQARANSQDVSAAGLALEVTHQPLFSLGGP
jgi:Transcription factor WhiB